MNFYQYVEQNVKITRELLSYISDYLNEELDRGNEINLETLKSAIDAYDGGAT